MEHLPSVVLDHMQRRLAVDFADRDRSLSLDVGSDIAKWASRGVLISSGAQVELLRRYSQEVRVRYRQTRLCLQQAMAALGGHQGPGFANAAMAALAPILTHQVSVLRAAMLRHQPFGNAGGAANDHTSILSQLDEEVAKADAELRLDLAETEGAAAQMATKAEGSPNSASVVGSNNIVLVGVTARDVSIRLDASAREAIQQAMDAVIAGLPSSGLPGDRAGEVLELAEECREAAQHERPNKMKLGSSLQAIAQAVQTVASMQGAYQAVKAALAMVGLSGGI